jgi:hypothetical protein
LLNSETSYITPLDFRLTAAAQFRLLASYCHISKLMIDETQVDFLNGKLVSSHMLSKDSFEKRIQTIVNKFYATLAMSIEPADAAQLTRLTLTQSHIQSAVHTDALTLAVPGSNQYTVVPNFYPLDDSASFTDVSL